MWLLDTKSYMLHEFVHEKVPPYAILSHRWEGTETSFRLLYDYQMSLQDQGEEEVLKPALVALRNHRYRLLTATTGWSKVQRFCDKAREHGLKYAWIDTCCIDKSSSAELQEAINSMYKWYHEAAICFVYLSDVIRDEKFTETRVWSAKVSWDNPTMVSFRASKWFTRGWTLQEMLAPRGRLDFLDRDWKMVGRDRELIEHISASTDIPTDTLLHLRSDPTQISSYTIAVRMSWTARRETTRPEDAVYSILGIFDVNMPLLYGEGRSKAFSRLLRKILKTSSEESIFAWNESILLQPHPLLAASPGDYATSLAIVDKSSEAEASGYARPPFTLSATHGLHMEMILIPITFQHDLFGRVDMLSGAQSMFGDETRALACGPPAAKVFASPMTCSSSRARGTAIFIYLAPTSRPASFRRVGPWVQYDCDWGELMRRFPPRQITINLGDDMRGPR